MSKTIPAQLVTHKALASTTLCNLLKIGPLPDGTTYLTFSGLNENVTYDDGAGAKTYIARTGVQVSAVVATADMGVDNAEAESLPPIDAYPLEGITQAQIDAGDLDKCPWVLYRVNYNDLTAGRHEVMASGTVGELRSKHGQLNVIELRSLSQQLKQSIVELDSLTCRAKFGSQVGEERHPCEYALAGEWVSGTVTAVGAESDTQFTDTSLAQAANYFAPGLVEWLTGDNAGQELEVGAFASSAVTLQFPTVSPISIGDTYRIRRDCTKNWTGHNSCETFWAADKPNHFRGEPHIPVADTAALNSPGAATREGNLGGTGELIEA